jgi:hypothetical protein
MEDDFVTVTSTIRYDAKDNFFARIRKTEKNVDDLVDFFEE